MDLRANTKKDMYSKEIRLRDKKMLTILYSIVNVIGKDLAYTSILMIMRIFTMIMDKIFI